MYEKFEELLGIKGYTAADVTRLTGISSTVFSEWKKGKSTPKTDKLILIARCLGTTVEYLMTGEKPEIPNFEPEHLELIELYSKLKDEQKSAIMNLLRSFSV